jgi:hypothetical protein
MLVWTGETVDNCRRSSHQFLFNIREETALPEDRVAVLDLPSQDEQWDPVNLIHLYKGSGGRVEDWQHEAILLNIAAHVIFRRGYLYTPEERLAVLMPTNAFKAMLERYINVPRPADAAPGKADLPWPRSSLTANLVEYNRHRMPLTPLIVAETITNAGWILKLFLIIATSISATGLTVVDTVWYKPYASAFIEKSNHSIVAASRHKGILFWITDGNTVREFNSMFAALVTRRLIRFQIPRYQVTFGSSCDQTE